MTKEGPDVLENADATSTEARRTSQTLHRGLQVLKCVAHLPRGGTATELANATGLERTVVHRLLNTLVASGFAEHTTGGVYRLGPEARALAALAGGSIAEFAQSRLQSLADRYAGTAMLCMAESDAIVAVAVAVPTRADSHLAYRRGSRHPIDRGAGARAILAGRAARPDEAPDVTAARAAGWVVAHGEVEAGAHAVAAPVSHDRDTLDACIMFVSHRPESVLQARDDVVALAAQVREYAINDGR